MICRTGCEDLCEWQFRASMVEAWVFAAMATTILILVAYIIFVKTQAK